MKKKTLYLALSAMLCALGVIILSVGSLVDVLDLTVAVMASLLCVYAVIEMRGAYPWMIWLVTSVLALLLLPQKTPALLYAAFTGFYPILKEKIEKRNLAVRMILKMLLFHLSMGAVLALLLVFFPAGLPMQDSPWLLAVLYLMLLLCFWLYDFALSRLITYYLIRLRPKFRIR